MTFVDFKKIRNADLDTANSSWNVHDDLKDKNLTELQIGRAHV